MMFPKLAPLRHAGYGAFVQRRYWIKQAEQIARRHPNRVSSGQLQRQRERLARHAEILERFVSPEGTFPAVGRSLGFRCGVMATLAFAAVRGLLPEGLAPGQARCALTAVMERFAEAPGIRREDGLLQPGFVGHQPDFTEYYLQDSSSYQMLFAFQILSLPPEADLWSQESRPWTNLKLWAGGTVPTDHALGHDLRQNSNPKDSKNERR